MISMNDVEPSQSLPKLNVNHLAALERFGGKRGHQAIAFLTATQMLWPVGKYFWEKRQKSEDFSITVPGVDNIYPDLHEWVLERIPKDERKALIATTSLGDYSSDEDEVRLRYDGSRIQDVTIDGHEVTVAVERENIPERVNLPENWRQFMEKITFTARTSKGRDAVIQMIDGLVKAREDEDAPPALYIPSRWGGEWNRRGLPGRDSA